jgi:hypothetical protein
MQIAEVRLLPSAFKAVHSKHQRNAALGNWWAGGSASISEIPRWGTGVQEAAHPLCRLACILGCFIGLSSLVGGSSASGLNTG